MPSSYGILLVIRVWDRFDKHDFCLSHRWRLEPNDKPGGMEHMTEIAPSS
jgi:hypothetical protein